LLLEGWYWCTCPSCGVMPVSVDACFTLRLSCPSSAIAPRSRQQRAASERRAVPAVPRTRPNPSREEGGPLSPSHIVESNFQKSPILLNNCCLEIEACFHKGFSRCCFHKRLLLPWSRSTCLRWRSER